MKRLRQSRGTDASGCTAHAMGAVHGFNAGHLEDVSLAYLFALFTLQQLLKI